MSKLIAIIALLVSIWIVGCKSPSSQTTGTKSAVTKVLHKCVEEQKRAPGMVIGVIDKNGTTVVGYGKFGQENKGVNGGTIFEIGSITKVFTSLLLQERVDRGELNLDDPIEKFLPASVKVPSKNGKQITLRDLATHRSGLPRLPDNLDPEDGENPYADYTAEKLYDFLSSYELPREPGEKYEYSNYGASLLGQILSIQGGSDYETLVVKRICAPLKMNSTRIHLTDKLKKRAAVGHDQFGMPVSNWDMPIPGAGSLRSSVDDLMKFLAANVSEKRSPFFETIRNTHMLQKEGDWMTPRMALGWHLKKKSDCEFVWHNGGTGGFRSFIGFESEKKRGVVVLSNSNNDVDDIGWHFLDARNEIKDYKARRPAKIDFKLYDNYVGKYHFGDDIFLNVTRKGDRLFVQLTDQSALEVYPESETKFFLTAVDAQITFEKNEGGDVSNVILHQLGMNQRAKKVK